MKPSELLKKGWCQGAAARDASGSPISASDSYACSWCLPGASYLALGFNSQHVKFMVKCKNIVGTSADLWNDAPGRTQAEVVALAERVEKEMGI